MLSERRNRASVSQRPSNCQRTATHSWCCLLPAPTERSAACSALHTRDSQKQVQALSHPRKEQNNIPQAFKIFTPRTACSLGAAPVTTLSLLAGQASATAQLHAASCALPRLSGTHLLPRVLQGGPGPGGLGAAAAAPHGPRSLSLIPTERRDWHPRREGRGRSGDTAEEQGRGRVVSCFQQPDGNGGGRRKGRGPRECCGGLWSGRVRLASWWTQPLEVPPSLCYLQLPTHGWWPLKCKYGGKWLWFSGKARPCACSRDLAASLTVSPVIGEGDAAMGHQSPHRESLMAHGTGHEWHECHSGPRFRDGPVAIPSHHEPDCAGPALGQTLPSRRRRLPCGLGVSGAPVRHRFSALMREGKEGEWAETDKQCNVRDEGD